MTNLLTFKHYLNDIYLYRNDIIIATICDEKISLISNYFLLDNKISHVVFKNYLGGLWEGYHQEIKESIYNAVSFLDEEGISSSIDFPLNRKYILK